MPNFLQETTEILARNGKTLSDIRRVCGDDFQITVDDFIAHANFEYNNGFGAQEVAHDLKVVGDDWWLERSEYDGAERWNFKTYQILICLLEKSKHLLVDTKQMTSVGLAWQN